MIMFSLSIPFRLTPSPVDDGESCVYGPRSFFMSYVLLTIFKMDCWWNAAVENQGLLFLTN